MSCPPCVGSEGRGCLPFGGGTRGSFDVLPGSGGGQESQEWRGDTKQGRPESRSVDVTFTGVEGRIVETSRDPDTVEVVVPVNKEDGGRSKGRTGP